MIIMKYIKSFVLILITILITLIFGSLLITCSWLDKKNILLKTCEFLWGKILIFFIGIKINIHGYDNIKNKRYIFCSNHSSALDIPIALSIIKKPIVFLAKKQLFDIPFFGWILSSVGMIKVNRENKDKSKQSVDQAIEHIKNSRTSILVYPEGTRTKDNSLKPFKKGCFIIALKSKLPILPITIIGAGDVMPKSSLLINKKNINIYFHKEISTKNYDFNDKDILLEKVYNRIKGPLDITI